MSKGIYGAQFLQGGVDDGSNFYAPSDLGFTFIAIVPPADPVGGLTRGRCLRSAMVLILREPTNYLSSLLSETVFHDHRVDLAGLQGYVHGGVAKGH